MGSEMCIRDRNEVSKQASSSTTSTDDQELLTSSTSSLVFYVRLSVSVIQFSVSEVKICLVLYSISKVKV